MGLNVDRYRHKQERLNTPRGGRFYKMQNGVTHLRLFTFDHKVTKGDYDRGNYNKNVPALAPKIGSKETELDREVWLHFREGEGPINCPRDSSCVHCQQSNQLRSSNSKADQQVGKKMSARLQHYINAFVEGADPADLVIATLPSSVFAEILGYVANPEYDPDELFGLEGRDFIITRDSNKTPDKMYQVQLRDAKRSAKLPKALLENIVDLYDMTELNAGWSSSGAEEPATVEDPLPASAEIEDEPIPEDEAAEQFKDDDQEDALIGKVVTFKDDDEKETTGKIVKLDSDGAYEVHDENGEGWLLDRGEFEIVETQKKRTRRKVK